MSQGFASCQVAFVEWLLRGRLSLPGAMVALKLRPSTDLGGKGLGPHYFGSGVLVREPPSVQVPPEHRHHSPAG